MSNITSSHDALAQRPTLGTVIPFKAPRPQVYKTPHGTTVWLIERPAIPVATLSLTLRRGAVEDPTGKAGLAHITTSMMDEGAGDRNAIEIAAAIDALGASLWGGASLDGSHFTLSAVTKHLDDAFAVFADVVARPRFAAQDFERTAKLWRHQLQKRPDNPQAIASVVARGVVYGSDTPYGHPVAGHLDSAARITLEDVVNFYRRVWRPDEAMLVVAGAVTRAELDTLINNNLSDWTAPTVAVSPVAKPSPPRAKRPRLVMVDRPDAPQTVIALAGPGVAADSEAGQLIELVNTALGGSFTSRLNQNLREERGWTYGVRSAFVEARGVGPFLVRTAVETPVTGAAVAEIFKEISSMAECGLSEEEFAKVRARDLTDTIETSETTDGLVGRLSHLAMLGLAVDHDARSSALRNNTTRGKLNALAGQLLDVSKLSVILVGPKDAVLPQLAALEMGEPEMWTAEGKPRSV